MQVICANVSGFCMGVRRAFDLTVAEAESTGKSGGRVATLGPLIHNPTVLAALKNLGVEVIEQPPEAVGSVIIRAHGIEPHIEKEMRCNGIRVIDATCPKVKASQLKARDLVKSGFTLFLAGDASHAEIAGIVGYADSAEHCIVVTNAAQAEGVARELNETTPAKTALIGQTTISEDEYSQIAKAIQKYFPNLEIVNTICSATKDRQQALRELLNRVEAVLIAGGKDSSNTRRLLAIAQDSGKPCALVETAGEIPAAFFNYQTVGLSAGASTPDSTIEEIEKALLGTGVLK